MPPRKSGRPLTLADPAKRDAILTALRTGAPRYVAAAAGGVTGHTFTEWVDRADPNHPRNRVTKPDELALFQDFAHQVEEVELALMLTALRTVNDYGRGFDAPEERITERYDPDTGALVSREVVRVTRRIRAWQAATWMLEHRFAAQFGTAARVELSGPAGSPVEWVDRTDDVRAAVLELDELAKRRAAARREANGAP